MFRSVFGYVIGCVIGFVIIGFHQTFGQVLELCSLISQELEETTHLINYLQEFSVICGIVDVIKGLTDEAENISNYDFVR